VAGGVVGGDDAHAARKVGVLARLGTVADGIDARDAGPAPLVNLDEAPVEFDARLFEPEVFGVGDASTATRARAAWTSSPPSR